MVSKEHLTYPGQRGSSLPRIGRVSPTKDRESPTKERESPTQERESPLPRTGSLHYPLNVTLTRDREGLSYPGQVESPLPRIGKVSLTLEREGLP